MNDMILEDDKIWYWFTNIEGLGRKSRSRLIEMFGSPKDLYCSNEDTIMNISFLSMGKRRKLADSRKQYAGKRLKDIIRSGISFIHKDSAAYPSRLKNIPDMPHSLYLKGSICRGGTDMRIFDMPSAAIVGSRKCSKYGYETAYRIGFELAHKGIAVVSGMARGIDSAALRGCIDAGGKPVAVLGCGVDICYPPANIELYTEISRKGIIMSEYPPGTTPLPGLFPERNRIISGLGDVLIVVEAGKRSGTFITVDMALEQGREVYAVPGRITDEQSKGCNSLIKQGAHVLLGADEIAEYINGMDRVRPTYDFNTIYKDKNKDKDKGIDASYKNTGNINENYINNVSNENNESNQNDECNENKVYSAMGILPKHIDMIAQETGLGINEVMGIICGLELKNLIKHTDNNYFMLNC